MTRIGIIVLLIIFSVYSSWFTFSGTLSSGDWPYLFFENIQEFSFFPEIRFLWLAPYYQVFTKIVVQYIGISWETVERIFWFWPFLLISIFSSYYFTKSWLGVLIYTTNTYILMIVGGGQMGIAMAYAITPFVLKRFMQRIEMEVDNRVKSSIELGLLFALLTMFDPRISYIVLFIIGIYFLFKFQNNVWSKHFIKRVITVIVIPLIVTIGINSYWIMSLVSGNFPKEYQGLDNLEGFKFFSFSDFSHSLSLLHPNWPENIFGKTYFLKPEFIILPAIAYSSLLFISIKRKMKSVKSQFKTQNLDSNLTMKQFKNTVVLFFCLFGLLGAFLSKGINEPFKEVNIFLFQNLPGMTLFRDPTKFYIMIILSYSLLIPFVIENITRKYKIRGIALGFTLLWCLLISPALFQNLSGTFKPSPLPKEYVAFKNFLIAEKNNSKTLWIPTKQRFGFSSKRHLALSANEIFQSATPKSIVGILQGENKHVKDPKKYLQARGIHYVIVPFDSKKELFIENRKYSEKTRNYFLSELKAILYLKKIQQFGEIVIFEVGS